MVIISKEQALFYNLKNKTLIEYTIDYIKVNYSEYLKSKSFIEKSDWIKNKLIVTRGKYGCDYNGKNFPTKDVSIKDVAGAGDTFLSGLIFKYIQNNKAKIMIHNYIFRYICTIFND